jgi:hypothetical protein
MNKTRFLVLFVAMAAMLMLAMPASAQSGSLSINSVSCPATVNSLGTATLSWSTDASAPDNIVVWVFAYSNNFFPDSSGVFAASRSGSGSAPWLQKGHSYVFVLYDSAGPAPSYTPGNFLAQASIQCQ